MELRVLQSLWGMEGLPRGRSEWSVEQQVERIGEAGFDGAAVDFDDAAGARTATAALAAAGLEWSVECIVGTTEALRRRLELAADCGLERASHVNVQADARPGSVDEAVELVGEWQLAAREAGLRLLFETHRDRMTMDLPFTLELLDRAPGMSLTADLSHYVAGRELTLPIRAEDRRAIETVVHRADAFHGRVASCEQVQIQIDFPHHREWLELFVGWWSDGFAHWRSRSGPGDRLSFTAELGPPHWYAITDSEGEEMSDRWAEALELRDAARRIWNETDS